MSACVRTRIAPGPLLYLGGLLVRGRAVSREARGDGSLVDCVGADTAGVGAID